MKAVGRLESEILAERARVLADPRPASYFALFKCAAPCANLSLALLRQTQRRAFGACGHRLLHAAMHL